MHLIAHRGNLYGPSPLENNPVYVKAAYQKGYDVEIDVWYQHGGWWLGHDEPKYPIAASFLYPALRPAHAPAETRYGYWCHAKNEDAFKAMMDIGLNCFWHDTDTYTLTYHKIVWTFPNSSHQPNAVWNQPEWHDVTDLYSIRKADMDKWVGVCSDYVALLKDIYDGTLLAKRDY